MWFAAWMKFNTHIGFHISRHQHLANAKQKRQNAQLFFYSSVLLLRRLVWLRSEILDESLLLLFRFWWRFIDQMNDTDFSVYFFFFLFLFCFFDFPLHSILYSRFQFRFGFSFMIPLLFVIFFWVVVNNESVFEKKWTVFKWFCYLFFAFFFFVENIHI